jgi:hypothetical protein
MGSKGYPQSCQDGGLDKIGFCFLEGTPLKVNLKAKKFKKFHPKDLSL